MTRRETLLSFVITRATDNRPIVEDRRFYRSADNGDDMTRDDNAIEWAYVRAERAGDLTLHTDDDGDSFARLTMQGRDKINRISRRERAPSQPKGTRTR